MESVPDGRVGHGFAGATLPILLRSIGLPQAAGALVRAHDRRVHARRARNRLADHRRSHDRRSHDSHAPSAASPGWLRRSLGTSVTEGMLAEVVGACAGGAALTGWALHLGFGQGMVGLLCALPVASQVFHLPAALLTERIGRRRLSLFAIGLSRLCWLALPLLLLFGLDTGEAQAAFVAVVLASSVLGVVGNNAWVVWMGELLPASMHGRYFGRRTALLTLAGSVVSLAAAVGMDRARAVGQMGTALLTLSVVAGLAGLGCLALLARQQERRRVPRPPRPPVGTLLAPLRDPAMRPLLAYQLAWNAAVGIAGTFFVVYLVRDLRMSFAFVAVHGAIAAAARMAAAPIWGGLLDRVGPERVLLVTGLGVAAMPLLWVLATPELLWPLAVDAAVGGALSSGHALALFGLPLRIAPRDGLASYVGALSSAAGAAFAASSALAGVLVANLPGELYVGGRWFLALDVIFVLAAIARVGAASLAWRIVPAEAVPSWGTVTFAGMRRAPEGRSSPASPQVPARATDGPPRGFACWSRPSPPHRSPGRR